MQTWGHRHVAALWDAFRIHITFFSAEMGSSPCGGTLGCFPNTYDFLFSENFSFLLSAADIRHMTRLGEGCSAVRVHSIQDGGQAE
jgi:hypothetical protein